MMKNCESINSSNESIGNRKLIKKYKIAIDEFWLHVSYSAYLIADLI